MISHINHATMIVSDLEEAKVSPTIKLLVAGSSKVASSLSLGSSQSTVMSCASSRPGSW